MEEATLVTRLKSGDFAAYEELIRTYGPRVLSVARRFLPREEDAEVAIENTFLAISRSINSYSPEEKGNLIRWMHRITVIESLRYLIEIQKSRGRRPNLEDID